MDFNVSGPFRVADSDFGVKEVGAGVSVEPAGVDDGDVLSAGLLKVFAKHSRLPKILV